MLFLPLTSSLMLSEVTESSCDLVALSLEISILMLLKFIPKGTVNVVKYLKRML